MADSSTMVDQVVVAVVAGAVGALGMWVVERSRTRHERQTYDRGRVREAVRELLEVVDATVKAGVVGDQQGRDAQFPSLIRAMRELQLCTDDDRIHGPAFEVMHSGLLRSIADLSGDSQQSAAQTLRHSQAESALVRAAREA